MEPLLMYDVNSPMIFQHAEDWVKCQLALEETLLVLGEHTCKTMIDTSIALSTM